MFLDASRPHKVVWGKIAAIIKDAYREVAPKKLIAQLDGKVNDDDMHDGLQATVLEEAKIRVTTTVRLSVQTVSRRP